MQKNCEACGLPFEAKRLTAKFCSDRCKQRAHRAPANNVVALPPLPPQDLGERPADDGSQVDGDLTIATKTELERAGRLDSALGIAAIKVAQRIDGIGMADTGSGVAALIASHRAALAEAVKDADESDAVDEIAASAALKLIRA